MAEAAPLAFNLSVPLDGLQGRSRLEKLLHKWLDGSDEAERRLKYVLWGPGGVGKSTLALKFAAGQAERGGGWLRLVFRLSASTMERDYAGLLDAMLASDAGKSAGRAPEVVRGRVHELLQSPAWSRAWLAVLDDLPAPADDELERAGLGWLMGAFPWAHGRSIITTRAAEWVQQGEDSREVSATDLQHCAWCGAGSLAMLKCGKCRLVYYCSVDCQKAARSQHKVVCVPKRNMDDVMGLSVVSFAEDEACSWVKGTVRQWRDDDAGVLELVRYLGCLPLAIGLASAHARVHGTASPAEFLAALKCAVPPPAQLEVGAKVELHSLNATEHNGKHGELLEYDAEAQRWAVELSQGGSIRVRVQNLALLGRDDCPPSLHSVVMLSRGKIQESGHGEAADSALRKMALLDSTAIPIDLLSSTEKKAVLVLKQHALVTVDDKDLVAMHSLTQLAVRGQTVKGDRRELAAAVARALEERLSKFDHFKSATFFIGHRYAAHARAVAANATAWGLIPAVVGGEARGGRRLLEDVRVNCMTAGLFFKTVGGQYQQALGMYEFSLVCAVALEGHDSTLVAKSLLNTGNLLVAMGRHEEARAQVQKGLDVYLAVYGPNHLDVATSYMGLGNVYESLGKYEEALEMHTKSLDIKTRILGRWLPEDSRHLLVAQSYCNMGTVCHRLGQYERSLEYFQKDLDITMKISGQHCPDVARSRTNTGCTLIVMGKHEEALVHLQKALQIQLKHLGSEHPDAAASKTNIGSVFKAMGKKSEAKQMFTEAASIHRKVLGPDHPLTKQLERSAAE